MNLYTITQESSRSDNHSKFTLHDGDHNPLEPPSVANGPSGPMKGRGVYRSKPSRFMLVAAILGALSGLAGWEMWTSSLQAYQLAKFARSLTFEVASGTSTEIRFPKGGPYDKRLGYSQLPAIIDRMAARGFAVESQARFSPGLLEVTDYGLFTPYLEKKQAGLHVLDRNGETIFSAAFPRRVYTRFEEISYGTRKRMA